jgi:hypothetical protein
MYDAATPYGDGAVYALVQDGNTQGWLEAWPRDPEGFGAINAITRAAQLSLRGEPVTVLRPDLTPLARFVRGAREGRTRPLRAPVRAVD